MLLAAVALLILGLAFKVAAVPFHTWTPDVYQGSPTPAVGFMAAVAKAGGFAALIRVLLSAFPTMRLDWRPIIWVLAVLTLLVGSVLAIVQLDVKRMLAYSSISHAGYVLVAVQAASSNGRAAALFYLLTYTFMVIGSFAVVSVIGGKGEARNDLGAYRGLASRRPGLAMTFTVLLLAQAGVPFTTGFLAKFYVVSAAVQQQQYALAVIAMLAAAIAAFFYLRIAILMYSPVGSPESSASGASGRVSAGASVLSFGGLAVATPAETRRILIPAGIAITLAISVAFTIAFGIVPAPVIAFARRALLLF
jgi:NADH-quinone oxidoreductase subunit N